MYQVSLKSEGGRPFFVITWPGITHIVYTLLCIPPAPPTPTEVTVQVMNASSVRVAWQWTSSGPAPSCFSTTRVTYRHPEGGGESSLQLKNSSATETILPDVQPTTCYTITVVATAGKHRRESVTTAVLRGMTSTLLYTLMHYTYNFGLYHALQDHRISQQLCCPLPQCI